MEAARVSALRGHKVMLYEREDKLGGHLIEASVPTFKEDIKGLMRWFSRQLEQLSVDIKLETEVTPKLVNEIKPDAMILAVGSSPIIPNIPGITKPSVTTAVDVLLSRTKLDGISEAVVVGGGFVGCETALYMVESGLAHKVTIVEMLDEIAIDVEALSKRVLLKMLNESGVKMLVGMKLEEITDDGIICIDKKWNRNRVKADKVVLAVGFKPRTQIVEALKDLTSEVYIIGDCVEARKIRQAIADGWCVARRV
jgi:2-enoate reductase